MAMTKMQNYGIQIAIALAFFIVGLIFLLVWAILYSNRVANGLEAEWWVWIFLGFGLGFMLVGLVWLIIIQYMVASKARELYEKVHFYESKEVEKVVVEEPMKTSTTIRTGPRVEEYVRPVDRTFTRTYS